MIFDNYIRMDAVLFNHLQNEMLIIDKVFEFREIPIVSCLYRQGDVLDW